MTSSIFVTIASAIESGHRYTPPKWARPQLLHHARSSPSQSRPEIAITQARAGVDPTPTRRRAIQVLGRIKWLLMATKNDNWPAAGFSDSKLS